MVDLLKKDTTNYHPQMKKIVLFKHGIGFFGLESKVKDIAKIKMQFKEKDMDDLLKSLFAVDLSGEGFISTIAYDADENIDKVLRNVSIRLNNNKSLIEALFSEIKGARVKLTIPGQELNGKVVGIDMEVLYEAETIREEPVVVLMQDGSNKIFRIKLTEIKNFKLLNKELNDDLAFYLDTIISRKQKDVKNVLIRCEPVNGKASDERDIFVSYLQEAPVWKASYRLVLPGDQATIESLPPGKGFLSGWGLVENQTPNDWESVELTLIAGAPITFKYPLYSPQYIKRKIVSLPTKASITPTAIEGEMPAELDAFAVDIGGGPPSAPGGGGVRGSILRDIPSKGGKKSFEESFGMMKDALKKSVSVATKDGGELFEYRISNPVTIKRNQSALVPIISEEIDAKKILLFDAIKHPTNPMACVEISNTSNLTLETGPITIMIEDSLAGESMLPFMIKNDTRLLNYALEQGVTVHIEKDSKENKVHRISFSGEYMYEYHYRDFHTTYKINNKSSSKKIMYIDHPKEPRHEIIDPPENMKETANKWRVTVDLEAKKAIKLEITTRQEVSQSFYIWNLDRGILTSTIQFYVENEFIDKETLSFLEEIVKLNEKRAKLEDQYSNLEEELISLNADQDRIRENLQVLGTASNETKLTERLVQKLTRQEARYEEISKELKLNENKKEEVGKKIKKLIAKVKLR